MRFQDKYKSDMDTMQPNPQKLKDLEQKLAQPRFQKKRERYRVRIAGICAAVAMMVLFVFGGSGLLYLGGSGTVPVNNTFSIVAYAAENGEESSVITQDARMIFPHGSIKRGGKLVTYIDENGEQKRMYDNTEFSQQGGFGVTGENIAKVTYTSEKGELHYFDAAMQQRMIDSGELKTSQIPVGGEDNVLIAVLDESDDPPYLQTGKTVTASYAPEIGAESLKVDWFLPEALDIASSAQPLEYEKLPGDVVTIAVTFTDGQTQTQKVKICFQSDGSFHGELIR